MRLVNYEVMRKDGSKFVTTSYAEARSSAYSCITRTFLTEFDEDAEKDAERLRKHRGFLNLKIEFSLLINGGAPAFLWRRNSIIPHRRTFCQEKICTNFKPKKSQNLCNIPILQTPSPSAIIILVKGTENKKTSKKN